MTDPKLNELPVDAEGDFANRPESSLSEEERARLSRNRAGLSIHDTIASDTTLSVGARGVNVSGVAAGAGAGAGSTALTPGGGSPAPNIVPGGRGSGVTPLADSGLRNDPSPRADLSTGAYTPTHEELSARAYQCWHRRGCPEGSPEIDWDQADRELREERRPARSTAASV
ncbi:MAG: DUF2934 domain-containing protein [Acidobacteriaceae bacterium]|nr:DUF2934 domain-containing protein [Acidobacteriaceae bacterium]MBV8572885.1 DUF2934 domain-containing protein [Acidobacteriaceae bacterium]